MLPDQGMKEFEILSRSTGFFIKSFSGKRKFHFVAPAHVTHPFLPRFKNYYPHEWLTYVTDKDTKHQIEICDFDGDSILSYQLGKCYLSRQLDLVISHLEDEDRFLEEQSPIILNCNDDESFLSRDMLEVEEYLDSEKRQVEHRPMVVVDGFTVVDDSRMLPIAATAYPLLSREAGQNPKFRYFFDEIKLNSPSRGSILTAKALHMGTCGAPVLGQMKNSTSGVVLGMIEASTSWEKRHIGVYVHASEILHLAALVDESLSPASGQPLQ